MTFEINYQDYQQALQFDRRVTQSAVLHALVSILIDTLNPEQTDRVLDVGTGTGRLGMKLFPKISQGFIVGIDSGYGMLKVAMEKISAAGVNNFFLVGGKAEALPFSPGSFHSACLMLSFHHFSDAERSLQDICQVLRPGGRLVSVDPVLKEPVEEEERRLNESIEEEFQLAHGPQFRFFTEKELSALYIKAGFSITSCRTHDVIFQQNLIEEIPMGPHWLQAYEALRFRRQEDLVRRFEKNYFAFRQREGQLQVRGKMSWVIIKAIKGSAS